MNIIKIIIAICSLLFIMIGVDKFHPFMEPPCSLIGDVSPILWKLLGVLQIAAGILIWLPKFRKYVSGIFAVLMLFFIALHLTAKTYDIGGALFMAVLLGLLAWNPSFLRGESRRA